MVQQAQQLGLVGWVCNRHDGSVEALACGSDQRRAALIAWARIGPAGACVEQVHVERLAETQGYGDTFVQTATL